MVPSDLLDMQWNDCEANGWLAAVWKEAGWPDGFSSKASGDLSLLVLRKKNAAGMDEFEELWLLGCDSRSFAAMLAGCGSADGKAVGFFELSGPKSEFDSETVSLLKEAPEIFASGMMSGERPL